MYTATVQITDVVFDSNSTSEPSGPVNAVAVSANLVSLVTSPTAENVFHLEIDTGSPTTILISPSTGDDDVIQLTFQLLGDANHTLIGIADVEPLSNPTGEAPGQPQVSAVAIHRDSHGSQLTVTDRCVPGFNWNFGLVIQRGSDALCGVFPPFPGQISICQ